MLNISACHDGGRQSSAGDVAHYIRVRHGALLNTSLMFAHHTDLRGMLLLRSAQILGTGELAVSETSLKRSPVSAPARGAICAPDPEPDGLDGQLEVDG